MPGTFFGLEIAKLALWANQRGMDVTSHNIANANTPGYTRQRALLRQATPLDVPGSGTLTGQLGSGVVVARVAALRSAFLDRQVWSGTSELSRWTAHRQTLERIEVIINEPTDQGIRGALDRWWEAWEVLAADPESMAARVSVLERSETLIATFQDVDRRLAGLQEDLEAELHQRVEHVNALAERIHQLNLKILAAEASGQAANDLRDQRALALEELAGHLDMTVVETERGMLRVILNGVDLVGEHGVRALSLDSAVDPVTGDVQWNLVWEGSGQAVPVRTGGIGGILEMMNQEVAGYRNDLLAMARALVQAVNGQHAAGAGLDGQQGAFFSLGPNDRMDQWTLLIDDPRAVAAAPASPVPGQPPAPGDGSNARALATLRYQALPGLGATLDDSYRSWVARLGVASAEAQRREEHQHLLMTQVLNQRDQVSGVSLDEEMAAMLAYQHAYQAAARMVTTVDQMLDTLINRTGVVGR